MIVDQYPRLDYSYMRSIRAEPSVYNHRFETLRNLIGVSKCFRSTFYDSYWETFEMALTYPRRRAPDPGQLDSGATESLRIVPRVKELHGLRKMFWNLRGTAACLRYDLLDHRGASFVPTLIRNKSCVFIRTLTFRVDRDPEVMLLFVDCLLALPNLHTLEIAPTSLPLVTLFGNAFKNRPQYNCIRKLIAPSGAHPILQCLPNLEELVCTRGEKPHILLTRVYQAYDSLNTKAPFRCFELIGSNWTDIVGKGKVVGIPACYIIAERLLSRTSSLFPEDSEGGYEEGEPKSQARLRFSAYHGILFQPSVSHLEKLTTLTEISELDLWILGDTETALIKRLKAKATEILRKSKPPTVCECDDPMDVDSDPSVKQEPGTNERQGLDVKLEHEETEPSGCRCKPPKRVFRLKYLVRKHGQWGTPFWGSDRVEEIEVAPLED